MADGDEFFDCFPSFSNLLCSESPTETTEDWENFLESQMSWDNDQLLSELADIPLADIPSPFFDHEALPVPREGQADVRNRPFTKSARSSHTPSVAHDHTYVQKPPVVSKVLVVKDGKSSVKETASSVRTRECSARFDSERLHTQLTKVNRGEQPLVLAHDDVGEWDVKVLLRTCVFGASQSQVVDLLVQWQAISAGFFTLFYLLHGLQGIPTFMHCQTL